MKIDEVEYKNNKNFHQLLFDEKRFIKITAEMTYLVDELINFKSSFNLSGKAIEQSRTKLTEEFPLAFHVLNTLFNIQHCIMGQDNEVRELVINSKITIFVGELQKIYNLLYSDSNPNNNSIYWDEINRILKQSVLHHFDDGKLFEFFATIVLLQCFSQNKSLSLIMKETFPSPSYMIRDILEENLLPEEVEDALKNSNAGYQHFYNQVQKIYYRVTVPQSLSMVTKFGFMFLAFVVSYSLYKYSNYLQAIWILPVALLIFFTFIKLITMSKNYFLNDRALRQLNPTLIKYFKEIGFKDILAQCQDQLKKNQIKLLMRVEKYKNSIIIFSCIGSFLNNYTPLSRIFPFLEALGNFEDQMIKLNNLSIAEGIGKYYGQLRKLFIFKKISLNVDNKKSIQYTYAVSLSKSVIDNPFNIQTTAFVPTLTQQRKIKKRIPLSAPQLFPNIQAVQKIQNDSKILDNGQLITNDKGGQIFLEKISSPLLKEVKDLRILTLLNSPIYFARKNGQNGLKFIDEKIWSLKHCDTDERVLYKEEGHIVVSGKKVPSLKAYKVVRGADKQHIIGLSR